MANEKQGSRTTRRKTAATGTDPAEAPNNIAATSSDDDQKSSRKSKGGVWDTHYYVTSKGKKKKKKYSRGFKELQVWDRNFAKSVQKLARAVDRGLARYNRLQEKSARKRRDGALKTYSKDATRGLQKMIQESAKSLPAIRDAAIPKRVERQIRKTAKVVLQPPPFLR
ncbi:MAG: hypothetical protein AAF481_16545 [Acidobacteriota bacterium]